MISGIVVGSLVGDSAVEVWVGGEGCRLEVGSWKRVGMGGEEEEEGGGGGGEEGEEVVGGSGAAGRD